MQLPRITRAVVWNQMLWTAGHALTSGGFLSYFGHELGASGFTIALILVIPETVGVAALVARWHIRRTGNRKRVWLVASLLARSVALGIPLLAFPRWRPIVADPVVLMACCLALAEALQAIAYTAYISWIADLCPEARWGRFFATRNIAKLSVLLVVPIAGGLLRDWWRRTLPPEVALLAYVVVFAVGEALLLASLLPLLRLPDPRPEVVVLPVSDWRMLAHSLADRSFRYLLVSSWWLAFFNGLTQAAFFRFQVGRLGLSLATYYVLLNLMQLLKIPISAATGFLADRFGNRALLFWSLLAASCAMPFWFLANREQWWWLFGAYAAWSTFATVNITGRNLLLKTAPRGDNTVQLALFRQMAGMIAGLSGLLGGWWLDRLTAAPFSLRLGRWLIDGFALLFCISWAGRVTAAFWLFPVQEPRTRPLLWMLRAWRRLRDYRKWRARQRVALDTAT